jgi:hypothetical protein
MKIYVFILFFSVIPGGYQGEDEKKEGGCFEKLNAHSCRHFKESAFGFWKCMALLAYKYFLLGNIALNYTRKFLIGFL